jgi:hypothetical protein
MSATPDHLPDPTRWWRGHHPLVWWITGAAALFSLMYSILVPVYRGPDELHHVDMIKYYGSSIGYPDPRVRLDVDPAVLASKPLAGPGIDPELTHRPPLSASEAQPRRLRPTFQELSVSRDPTVESRGNRLTQHPALHYVLASSLGSLVGTAFPEQVWTWDREVWLYRLISLVLVAPLPLLAATAARSLGLSSQGVVIAAAAMFLIPMRSFIGAIVNNDATMVLGAAIAATAALAHLRRPSWQNAAVSAGGAAIATWSKSTGATLLPWVLIVVLVAAVPVWRAGHRRDALTRLLVAGSISVVGAGWLLTNLVRFADPQPTSSQHRVVEGVHTSLWPFLQTWFERVGSTFWGQPARRTGVTLAGWLVTSLTVAVIVATIVLVVVVFRRRRHRKVVLLLGILWIMQLALLIRTNLAHYGRTGEYAAMQGRYLYAALLPLALLIALFIDEVVPRRVRGWGVAAAVAIGAALHLVLAGSMLNGYWAGSGLSGRIESVLAWSPLPDIGGILVLALPLIATGLLAVAVLRTDLGGTRLTRVLIGASGTTGNLSHLARQGAVSATVTLLAAAFVTAFVS